MANIGFHKIIVVCRFLVLVQTYLYQSVFLFYLWFIFSSNTADEHGLGFLEVYIKTHYCGFFSENCDISYSHSTVRIK